MSLTARHGKPLFLILTVLSICAAAQAQTRDGSIVGRVQNTNGLPVPDMRVAAFQFPDAKGLTPVDPIAFTTTDTEGRYRLSSVPPGRYSIVLNVGQIYFDTDRQVHAAPVVTLGPEAQATQDIVFSPPRGVTLSGRVHQEMMDRNVRVIHLRSPDLRVSTTVDIDGTFSLSDVPPGDYVLTLPEAQFAWTTKNIHVEDQNIANVEVIPDDSIPVLGRVVTEDGSPVPRFLFSLTGTKGVTTTSYIWTMDSVQSSPPVGVSGWADRPDDVLFHASLPIGEYNIAVTRLPPGYRVKSFSYGSTTNLLKKPLNLTGWIQQLTIVLTTSAPHSASVKGNVVFDVPLPPELPTNRVVLSSPLLLAPLEAQVRSDGAFEIPRVPPGNYWITAPNLGWRLTVGSDAVRGLEIRASRILALYEAAVRRASIPSPQRPTVDVEPLANFTEKPERDTRTDLRESKFEGYEVPARPATKSVKVRVIADSGYALPFLALTVRPNIDAGPPYVEPYTLRSTQGNQAGGLMIGRDGRFAISLPEGRHRIRVDAGPDSYRVMSVTYGSVNLTREPLTIGKGNTKEIVITVSELPNFSWGTVKGRMEGLANFPRGGLIVLGSAGSKVPLFETTPEPDGTFEFSKLPPGKYELLTSPRMAGVPSQSIDVREGEAAPLSLTIPAQRTLNLKLQAEDGSLQPALWTNLSLSLTLSGTEAYSLILSIPMAFRSASEWKCVSDVCSPTERMVGEPSLRRDMDNATTTLTLAEGDYRVEVSRVSEGKILRSLTSGTVDLRDQLLHVGPASQEITITLSK